VKEYWRAFSRWVPGGVGVLLLITTRYAQFRGWIPSLVGIGLVGLAYGLVLLAVTLEGFRAMPRPLTSLWSVRWVIPSLLVFGILLLIVTQQAEYEGWVSPSIGISLTVLGYCLVLGAAVMIGWHVIRQSQAVHHAKIRSTPSFVMLGILWLGTALRLHHLHKAPLWFDELWSVYVSHAPTLLDLPSRLPMNWTPAYPLALQMVRPLFGETEFAMRWPAAMAGVISIAAIYTLGKRLYSQRAGMLAAGLLAVSLPFVSYSQEARSYAFIVVAGILCSTVWFDLLRRFEAADRPILPMSLLYIAAALFMTSSHFVGLVILVIQALVLTLRFIHQPPKLSDISILYTAIGFGCAIILIPNFLRSFTNGFQWLDWFPPLGPLPFVLAVYLAMPFAYSAPLAIAAYLLAGISVVLIMRKWQSQSSMRGSVATVFLLLWWIVPFIAVVMVSILIQPLWNPRYVLAMLPPVLLLVSGAISLLPISRMLHTGLALILIAGLGGALLTDNPADSAPYYSTKNESLGYRTGVRALEQVLKDDPHAVWGWTAYYSPEIYEYDLDRSTLGDPPLGEFSVYQLEKVIDKFDAALDRTKPSSIWLLFFGTSPNELTALIEQSRWKLTLIEKRNYDKTTLWHFRVEAR